MIQVLGQLATHTVALLLYPGLVMIALFGTAAETVWVRVSEGRWVRPDFPWRRPSPVLTTVALSAMLAAVQMSATFNLVPSDERNLFIAAIALGLTVWVELALGTATSQQTCTTRSRFAGLSRCSVRRSNRRAFARKCLARCWCRRCSP